MCTLGAQGSLHAPASSSTSETGTQQYAEKGYVPVLTIDAASHEVPDPIAVPWV